MSNLDLFLTIFHMTLKLISIFNDKIKLNGIVTMNFEFYVEIEQ